MKMAKTVDDFVKKPDLGYRKFTKGLDNMGRETLNFPWDESVSSHKKAVKERGEFKKIMKRLENNLSRLPEKEKKKRLEFMKKWAEMLGKIVEKTKAT